METIYDDIKWYFESEEAWEYASRADISCIGGSNNYWSAYDEAHFDYICARKKLKKICNYKELL